MSAARGRPEFVLTLLFLLMSLLVSGSGLLRPVDYLLLDPMLRARAAGQVADPSILVIDIDERSIKAMEQYVGRWPWPRSIHAELVEMLQQQGARAILFDVLFSERDLYRPDADAYFGEVLLASERVYLPILQLSSSHAGGGRLLSSLPAGLQAAQGPDASPGQKALLLLPEAIPTGAWRGGTINFVADEDGHGRRYDLRRNIGGWQLPSLPARVAADLGASLPESDRILLNWQSVAPDSHTTVSYAEVYATLAEGRSFRQADFFKDRIVLIGASAAGLHDIKDTPLSPSHPGMYLLSTALDNLLNDEYLLAAPAWLRMLSSLLLILVLGLSALLIEQVVWLALTVALVMAAWACMDWLALGAGWELGAGGALMLGMLYMFCVEMLRYWSAYRDRQQTIQLFGRFMDPGVVQTLTRDGLTESTMQGRTAEVTVLFSDIRNFTSLSEKHSAAEVLAMLNDYLGRQVNVIFRHGGTLDKFIGDAIMAFWGAPLDSDSQQRDAISAALDMAEAMEQFRRESGIGQFEIGIGIHSGPAMVGMVGSERRLDYTVIGDTVNVASRIEGLTKGRARVLVSEEVRRACSGDCPFEFDDKGEFRVKGREHAVRVFEPARRRQ